MKLISKCIAGLLVVSVIELYFPNISLSEEIITRHEPKIIYDTKKDIPVVASPKPNYLLIGGVAVLVVGLAAAAGGAGGGGGGGGGSDSSDGNIAVSW